MKNISEVLEEFDKKKPQDDLNLELNGESDTYPFGYKMVTECCIFTVTDWGNIRKFVEESLKERDVEWLKRIEELVPKEQDETVPGFRTRNFGWNECRQEILNKIKEL